MIREIPALTSVDWLDDGAIGSGLTAKARPEARPGRHAAILRINRTKGKCYH